MKERPILFSAPMVRALLDGSKTQTRRVCKQQPYSNGHGWDGHDIICHNDYLPPSAMLMDAGGKALYTTSNLEGWESECPYGQTGDRLYVRETFIAYGRWETRFSEKKKRDEWHFVDMTTECDRAYQFAADNPDVPLAQGRGGMPGWWVRPAIHMPRVASRIMLEIVSVRCEPLNDCSEADAKAEGVMQLDADQSARPEERTKDGWKLCPNCCGTGLHSALGAGGGVIFDVDCRECDTHAKLYRHLWESINGAGSWAANPWVWVVEFKRVAP
jgi:hypothetical protein